jgi:hypothetical protein
VRIGVTVVFVIAASLICGAAYAESADLVRSGPINTPSGRALGCMYVTQSGQTVILAAPLGSGCKARVYSRATPSIGDYTNDFNRARDGALTSGMSAQGMMMDNYQKSLRIQQCMQAGNC